MFSTSIQTLTPAPDLSMPALPRLLQRFRREDHGSTLIEFAMTLPIFLLLIFGAFQCSLALFDYCNVTYAARVSARYASLHSADSLMPATSASVQSVATSFLLTTLESNAVVIAAWTPSNTVGSTVQVTVQTTLPLAIPFTSIQQFRIGSTSTRTILR